MWGGKEGMKKPLPIGVDNFEKMITDGYYYIDKTIMIKELLDLKGEVNLFTRPRRFGKTLNMSMLKYFFEAGSDVMPFNNITLFDGLEISKEKSCVKNIWGNFRLFQLP